MPLSLKDQVMWKALLEEQKKANIKHFSVKLGKIPEWLEKENEAFEQELIDKGMKEPFMSAVTVKPDPENLAEVTPPGKFHRILILGDSGTGKTHFIGTMPSPFIADFDRGLSTLRGKPILARAFDLMSDGWEAFRAEVMDWRKGPQYECSTFALDSLTMASEAAMTYVLKKNNRKQPTIADWGDAIREVKEVLGYLTTLPCHVVVTAHNQLVRDEVLGDIQYLPLIFGKDLPHRLGIWFDEVYATTVATTVQGGKSAISYRLQVKPDGRNKILKSRMNTDGKLFEMFEDPDFLALTKKTEPSA